MKLRTETIHTENKIRNLHDEIQKYEKKLYKLYKKAIKKTYEDYKKENKQFALEYFQERLTNLYFLADLDQSEFSRLQINAEIDTLKELKEAQFV